MSATIAECLERARQCEWHASRTSDEASRKFLLWKAQQWMKLAREKELESSPCEDCRLGPQVRPYRQSWSHYYYVETVSYRNRSARLYVSHDRGPDPDGIHPPTPQRRPDHKSLQAEATTYRSPGSVDCPGFFFVSLIVRCREVTDSGHCPLP
jgi:hypothetical protein